MGGGLATGVGTGEGEDARVMPGVGEGESCLAGGLGDISDAVRGGGINGSGDVTGVDANMRDGEDGIEGSTLSSFTYPNECVELCETILDLP